MDGDDWIDAEMYETLVSAMEEQGTDMAVCRYRKVFDDHTDDRSTPLAAVFEGQELLAKYLTLVSAMEEQGTDMAVCRYRKVFDDHTDDRSTPLAAVFEGQELLAKYLEEDEKWLIQTAVWNKLWRRSLSEGLKFPQSLYEDMYFTIRLLARSQKSVYLDTAFYNYYCSRAESTTNIGLSQKTQNIWKRMKNGSSRRRSGISCGAEV